MTQRRFRVLARAQCDWHVDEKLNDVQGDDAAEDRDGEFSFSDAMLASTFRICFYDLNFINCFWKDGFEH